MRGLKASLAPSEILYDADTMTGQDAVRSAGEFHFLCVVNAEPRVAIRRLADRHGERAIQRNRLFEQSYHAAFTTGIILRPHGLGILAQRGQGRSRNGR